MTPPIWWNLCPQRWTEIQARLLFRHRTNPKPRPEGYRNYSEKGTIGHETVKMVGRGMFSHEYDSIEPHHGLLTPETGKVPPEPSKGHGDDHGGVETAFCWRCKKPIVEPFDSDDPETCQDCGSDIEAHSSRME